MSDTMHHWFDTHCHFAPEKELEVPAILAAARQAGVEEFLVQGTSMEDVMPTLALTSLPGVYVALGIHPHEAAKPYDISFLREQIATHPRVLAVGELGLDYFYDFAPRAEQQQLLARFLDLAVLLHKPVVIHCREAFHDCYAILREHVPLGHPMVIHSFTGTIEECHQWLELGAYISVNGMVTFKKSDNIRASLAEIPLDKLLLETDSPYLAPVPLRGTENTPANIPLIGEYVARQRNLTTEHLQEITTANAHRFLNL